MNELNFKIFVLACCFLVLGSPLMTKAETKPDKRLLQKISINVEEQSVEEVVKDLGKKAKLTVEFDPSVAAEGLGQAKTFSLKADGIMLSSVLNLVCGSENLVYKVEKGRLVVATRDSEEKNMVVREYSLAELETVLSLPNFIPVFTYGLMHTMEAKWEDEDGEGGKFVEVTPQGMRVLQTPTGHAELSALLEQITAGINGRPVAPSAHEKADQAIIRKLKLPQAFAGDETKLPDLFEKLLRKNGIPFWVDETALKDAKIDWTQLESTVETKKLPTSARLDAIAADHQLVWRVTGEVVQITSADKFNRQLVTRVYDLSKSSTPKGRPLAVMGELYKDKSLGPWVIDEGDGGSIFPIGTLLVIQQYPKSHAAIAKLLD